jgi:hypothetical protein
VENWVKKCGIEVYQTAGIALRDASYAQVTDESMMIGSQKLLLTLGIPAEHPLNSSEIHVLDMAVAETWNGESVGKRLQVASDKAGHAALYLVTDNASIMIAGARHAGMRHYHDISHPWDVPGKNLQGRS